MKSAKPCRAPRLQVFLEQGYHRATLNDVAERLNITKPALYNYFGGKDEILFECWAVGAERVDECIAAINAGDGNGLDKLRRLTRLRGNDGNRFRRQPGALRRPRSHR